MIKKLDKLIIKSFLGPFIVTFFIAFFVLMMQNLWKYIDDLVGKGLDLITIGKFLWYISSSLLTLAIPIAILISSIMTFGNLGESFELVAIKSSGVSLLRFMRPLMWIAIFLSCLSFLSANYVIPYANLKFITLYNDIFYTNKISFKLNQGNVNASGNRFNDTRRIGLTFRYNFGIKPKEEKKPNFEQPAESKE